MKSHEKSTNPEVRTKKSRWKKVAIALSIA
jgi:hypothetical protein